MIRPDSTSAPRIDPLDPTGMDSPSFQQVFHADCVFGISDSVEKSTLIHQLVDRLATAGRVDSRFVGEIANRIVLREADCSTAFGKGFAFPHLRSPHVTEFVGALGVAADGLDFGAQDRVPTKLVLLTLSPHDERQQHAELLSRLVNLMNDKAIAIQISQQPIPSDVYRCLGDLDRHSPANNQQL